MARLIRCCVMWGMVAAVLVVLWSHARVRAEGAKPQVMHSEQSAETQVAGWSNPTSRTLVSEVAYIP